MKLIHYLLLGTIALLLGSSVISVDTNEVAVIYRLGSLDRVEEPGLRFRLPYPIEVDQRLETKTERSIDLQTQEFVTGDVNLVSAHLVAQYIINDPRKYSLHSAQPELLFRATVHNALSTILGQSTVDEQRFLDRSRLQNQIKSQVQKQLNSLSVGIRLESVELKVLAPPTSVEAAYNESSIARGEKETMIHSAKSYASSTEPKARGQAKQILEEAKEYVSKNTAQAKVTTDRFVKLLPIWKKSPTMLRQTLRAETWQSIEEKITTYYLQSEDILILEE